MTLNSSHTAGDTGHIADHNTIAAFVDTHDDVDTSATAHHHSLGTAATQAAAGNHTHSGLPGGAATAVQNEAVGSAAAVGTSTNYARQDHVHGMPAAGVASTQAIGDAAAQGSASTVALSDHKHGMPAFAGAGSATTLSRSDHYHPAAPIILTPPVIGNTTWSGSANYTYFARTRIPEPITVTAASIYSGTTTAWTVTVGMYTDVGGTPGSPIFSTTIASSSSGIFATTGLSYAVGPGTFWMAFAATAGNTVVPAGPPGTSASPTYMAANSGALTPGVFCQTTTAASFPANPTITTYSSAVYPFWVFVCP